MVSAYINHLVKSAEGNYVRRLEKFVGNLGLKVHKFLDVGCGGGEKTLLIAKACNAKEVYGMEIDEAGIKDARKRKIKIVKEDVSKEVWRVKDDTFDFVFSNNVIEHLFSVDNFLINIKRVLKKGGTLLLSTENLSAWHNTASLFLGFQPFSTTNICIKKHSIGNPFSSVSGEEKDAFWLHRSVFTSRALKEFLLLYGFKDLKPVVSGYYPFPNVIGNQFAELDPSHSVYIAFLAKNEK
ncbi:hypothetical protein A2716_03660 [candidate division WWE3 bacterium RIFCSPHIGHO2_01_FULL_40_23]|uniref:Methyltransferase type 11 domain-containing protein n=1 Tax=candidate division WWE3 bacterium RIFCSPLOWO2_01_FULL_41_18 TaxID=1802625 RepID=A0A1F4VCQ1_UNCKA|nr:MAG: hypothetical protein A2716_03660 [candidate division WWE3 bacterium RIFCSPHIGHO2_01_FULL_40_23]OGC54975.1 MAG: hypothetical protein A3A78_03270 [candidate division WWE3 bacterium RIFCSPLOWO2_01_FULL_41_18]